MRPLIALIGIFFCSTVVAEGVSVGVAEDATKTVSFYWSGNSASFKSRIVSPTPTICRPIRDENTHSVDKDGRAYSLREFRCQNGMVVGLKQLNENNQTSLHVFDSKGKEVLRTNVFLRLMQG